MGSALRLEAVEQRLRLGREDAARPASRRRPRRRRTRRDRSSRGRRDRGCRRGRRRPAPRSRRSTRSAAARSRRGRRGTRARQVPPGRSPRAPPPARAGSSGCRRRLRRASTAANARPGENGHRRRDHVGDVEEQPPEPGGDAGDDGGAELRPPGHDDAEQRGGEQVEPAHEGLAERHLLQAGRDLPAAMGALHLLERVRRPLHARRRPDEQDVENRKRDQTQHGSTRPARPSRCAEAAARQASAISVVPAASRTRPLASQATNQSPTAAGGQSHQRRLPLQIPPAAASTGVPKVASAQERAGLAGPYR